MPVTIAELSANRRKITVTYFGSTVEVVYQPAAYTADLARAYATIAVVDFFCALVVSIDVLVPTSTELEAMGDDPDLVEFVDFCLGSPELAGKPWPITSNWVRKLPLRLIDDASTQIVQDARLGEAEGS